MSVAHGGSRATPLLASALLPRRPPGRDGGPRHPSPRARREDSARRRPGHAQRRRAGAAPGPSSPRMARPPAAWGRTSSCAASASSSPATSPSASPSSWRRINPTWGGTATGTAFFIQDAFVSVKLTRTLFIDAGMMLAPFTHHSMQGAVGLHTLDYHASLVRFPRNEGKVWRDAGVQVRGFAGPCTSAWASSTASRAPGPTTPPRPPRPRSTPTTSRVLAYVRYNLLGTEAGFFLSGIYFEDQPKLSMGVGADYQPRSVLSAGEERDDFNVGMDLFLEYPLANDQGSSSRPTPSATSRAGRTPTVASASSASWATASVSSSPSSPSSTSTRTWPTRTSSRSGRGSTSG